MIRCLTIFKKYVKKNYFNSHKEESYKKFLLELKRLYKEGYRIVSINTLHFYIRRYTWELVSNPKGCKKEWQEKARRYYFKFWIKRAENSGFIVRKPNLCFELQEKILKVE